MRGLILDRMLGILYTEHLLYQEVKNIILLETTIAAISTPIGEGGIGIVRLSGPEAVKIVDSIFVNPKGKRISDARNWSILYGHIKDPDTGNDIDEVLVSVMRGPHSYTGENVVEVNCHGGILPVRKVLEAVIKKGAVLAQPGEFTKRAFINGRIDLAQAESVIDIITSKTEAALDSSLMQLEGHLSRRIEDMRQRLMEVLAHIAALVDYPEEDVEELEITALRRQLMAIDDEVKNLLATADTGRIIREGLKTSIVGKPNVGKSSLLNALSKADRAIVTDIPGTTRDIIEEYVNIKGILLNIVDTAGIRETSDEIEQIGIKRTRDTITKADLVIFMMDASQPLSDEDRSIAALISSKKAIAVLNKIDLGTVITQRDLKDIVPDVPVIKMSLKDGSGLDSLENIIADMVYQGKATISGQAIITNARHKEALIRADNALQRCLESIDDGMPIDMVSIDLTDAAEALGLISGQTIEDEVVDRIFERFCVGK